MIGAKNSGMQDRITRIGHISCVWKKTTLGYFNYVCEIQKLHKCALAMFSRKFFLQILILTGGIRIIYKIILP